MVLVGGGPGDPDLITVRGLRELQRADVVVVDRLAPSALLADLGPHVEVVDVGKTAYHHPIPQSDIEAILIDRARRGLRVVRLKGGDPFVLGRGGEEVLACRAARVPVEVVPGVCSALAAPAIADVTVTHRQVSRSVTIVSGHDPLDCSALAQIGGTIVVLMGMSRLHELSAGLIGAGLEPGLPVRVVHRAFSDRQQIVDGDLSSIGTRCVIAGVGAPAVIVIGEVAAGLDALGRTNAG